MTTGASADLQHVSELARRMVTQWGMSEKLGLVAYDSDQPVFMGMEYEYGGGARNGYSQKTAAEIDDEVRRLISEAHEKAVKLLKENRSILDNMSRISVGRVAPTPSSYWVIFPAFIVPSQGSRVTL